MSVTSISPPFPIFSDSDGQPLENGYIWIGTANLNPQVNPINVYWDADLLVPAGQPIRTLGGYPSNNNTPARLFVSSSDYSILVQNKNAEAVYSAASTTVSLAASLIVYTPGPDSLLTATNVQDALDALSDEEAGSASVGFINSSPGAVARSVQSKLQEIVSRSDFVDNPSFIAGKGNKPNIDGSNNFNAKVTPDGEAQIELSTAVLSSAGSNRAAVRYYSPTGISISCARHIVMGGFRFFGQMSNGRAPMFSLTTGGQQVVSLVTDLGAEGTAHLNGWYAVFACANDGDASPVFKLMPCLRVGSVVGSQATLCSSAEAIHVNTPTNYSWNASNNLNDVDCLVINETVSGRTNAFSGRVTKITANTLSTVTLAGIGAVGAFDWLLPAPPGFSHYCYQCMFYYESPGDVRNIADSGSLVKAKLVNSADPNYSANGQVGTIASPVNIRFGGYISPLATAVVVKETSSFSTASIGTYAAYFDIDGSMHIVQTAYFTKEGLATETQVMDNITIPFCFKQSFYYSNAGTLVSVRVGGTLEITGWIEV